jgi:hypothetical protein
MLDPFGKDRWSLKRASVLRLVRAAILEICFQAIASLNVLRE